VDGLGRLSQVTEDPGGLGYNTYYLYDGQDNLTGVCQNGTWSGTTCQGGMGRSFTYSSLSRLISATNPESGTITYGVYDPNGNLTSKTDARGVNTALTYDPLNRLKTKSYTDGTPGVT
jgi:YD repeat-containing protein